MSEHIALQLTAEEASRRIAADIRAYPQSGPDKREEHLRLFGALLSHDDIEGLWADRYAEIARAGQAKLANLGKRFDALRPKIDDAKRKLTKAKLDREKIEAKLAKFRAEQKARTGASFFGSAPQPTAEPTRKDNVARKAVIAKFIEANPDLAAAKPKPEPEELEEEPEVAEPEEEATEEPEEEPTEEWTTADRSGAQLSRNTPLDTAKLFTTDRLEFSAKGKSPTLGTYFQPAPKMGVAQILPALGRRARPPTTLSRQTQTQRSTPCGRTRRDYR